MELNMAVVSRGSNLTCFGSRDLPGERVVIAKESDLWVTDFTGLHFYQLTTNDPFGWKKRREIERL